MADYAKFYVNGPYLHNPPGYSRIDMFKRNEGAFQAKAKSGVQIRGIAQLRDKKAKALAAEKRILCNFWGVGHC